MEDIRDEKVQDEAAAEETGAADASGSSAEKSTGQTGENPEVNQPGGQESSGQGVSGNTSPDEEGNAGTPDQKSDQKSSSEETAEEASGTEKKGFFSKKKKEKDKRDQQIEELTDRVQRQMAEFDNFRKRSEKEKASMFEVGAKSVLEKILPTVDNFERGFANLDEEQKQDAFVQGMEKVYRQLLTALDGIGVKPIEAVGQPFDPNFHNAVMHVEDEEAGENVVVEEFQKGYLYRDSVLRHSMVKVAN
ncbi:MAG: nucleotide exchange factor GrpE [Lachnospiraceae bacterium]|nr:nucleotide exchange factor GrpE [Lachnospiraceae bacterium]